MITLLFNYSFCQVHGDFERKQRLFYALKARKAVKLRQIEAVQRELRAFNDAALVFDQIMEMKKVRIKLLSFLENITIYNCISLGRKQTLIRTV